MENGYVKLWRKSMDSGLIQDHKTWTFWCWCLMKATWRQRQVAIHGQIIVLLPGQFIFGRKKAAIELNMSEQAVRTCLKKLKKYKNLTIKSTNKYSIITIINWGIYQEEENATNQQTNRQLTSNQPTTNHKQEGKEGKERKRLPVFSENDMKGAKFLYAKIREHSPHVSKSEQELKSWANTFRLMIERDGRTEEQITVAIKYATQDTFWQSNILSAGKLRKHMDVLLTQIKNRR